METNKSIELLREIRQQAEGLKYDDYTTVTKLRTRLTMLIKKIFSADSSYLNQLQYISFNPAISIGGTDIYMSAYNRGRESLLGFIDTMLEDVHLSASETVKELPTTLQTRQSQNELIFVVHGQNDEMKQSVARTIEQLGLKPIILHEQANKGRTIIEKFTDHSDVSFAIVLLSADDFGYSIKEKPENGKLRARQNVILELGFFLGKLGRQKVVALFETNKNFEFPSDYQGVVFIPYDNGGRWKFYLLRELKACDYDVDANKIL